MSDNTPDDVALSRSYRAVPTPILRQMIARDERDGFTGTLYTAAMRTELARREGTPR